MALAKEAFTQESLDSLAQDKIHELYDVIERRRPTDQPPSEVAKLLKMWDLDDHYREWFETGDEEWS
jgi:hypothetical protein